MENKPNQPENKAPIQGAAPMQAWPEQTPSPVKIQYVVAQKSLNGIGGWLIFWLVVFSIGGIGEIMSFFTMIANGATSATDVLFIIFAPIIAVGYIGSVVLIAMRKKLAKLTSIAAISVMSLYSILNVIITTSQNYSDGQNITTTIGGIIGSLIMTGLLILYFMTSKRVRQTLVN
jgi:hypothetical protein